MNQWDQYELRRVTLAQKDPGQVPQQHVLVRVPGLAAKLHGPPHHGQGFGVEPLQIQDGGQVAHQHQGLQGDSSDQTIRLQEDPPVPTTRTTRGGSTQVKAFYGVPIC